MLISSNTSDSEVSEVSEPYIQRLRKVLAAEPSKSVFFTNMIIRSRARKENQGCFMNLYTVHAIAVHFE
jgi:hypothetical protein